MAGALTEVDDFTTSVIAADDGDDFTANVAFKTPLQSLANRTRYLANRIGALGVVSVTTFGADVADNPVSAVFAWPASGAQLVFGTVAALHVGDVVRVDAKLFQLVTSAQFRMQLRGMENATAGTDADLAGGASGSPYHTGPNGPTSLVGTRVISTAGDFRIGVIAHEVSSGSVITLHGGYSAVVTIYRGHV